MPEKLCCANEDGISALLTGILGRDVSGVTRPCRGGNDARLQVAANIRHF
jgi:hypothetical protein